MQVAPKMTPDVKSAENSLADFALNFENVPCSHLGPSTLALLGKYLQSTQPETLSSEGHLQSWIGLAELMNIDNYEIENLSENKANVNCFKKIFYKWKTQSGSTVAALINLLDKLERYDILEDTKLIKLIKEDVEKNKSSSAQGNPRSPSPPGPQNVKHGDITEFDVMTTDDVEFNQETKYDAYVSYVIEDMPFVMELLENLETEESKLKLCVDARDLLVGQAYLPVSAKLIQQRCRKVIVIVSEAFLKSELNLFHVRFAHAMSPASVSKRLIPVLVNPNVEIEKYLSEISFLSKLTYRQEETPAWFWTRLIRSVQGNVHETVDLEPLEPELSDIKIEQALLPVKPQTGARAAPSLSSSDSDEGIDSMLSTVLSTTPRDSENGNCSLPSSLSATMLCPDASHCKGSTTGTCRSKSSPAGCDEMSSTDTVDSMGSAGGSSRRKRFGNLPKIKNPFRRKKGEMKK